MSTEKDSKLKVRDTFDYMLSRFKDRSPELTLFSTFNFSASFFETNILPLFGGYSFENLKSSEVLPYSLNNSLKGRKIAVICDRSAHPEPKGNYRYGLLPVGLKNGRFHPKIMLMYGDLISDGKVDKKEKGLWLSVGSCNISFSGWARNREVIGCTRVVDKHRSELEILLRWMLKRAGFYSKSRSAAEEGETSIILNDLLDCLENNCPKDKPDSYPDLFLGLPEHKGGSLLSRMKGKHDYDKAIVVSPYWAGVSCLRRKLGARDTSFVPSIFSGGKHLFNCESKDLLKYKFLKFNFGNNENASEAERFTHAKVLWLEKKNGNYLCVGSANFTEAAMLGKSDSFSNVEMMLRYSVTSKKWSEQFTTLDVDRIATNTDASEGAPPLPPFEAEVLYDWDAKKFKYLIDCDPVFRKKLTLLVGGIEYKDLVRNGSLDFDAKKPIRSFVIKYPYKNTVEKYYGLVIQLGGDESDLGYKKKRRLDEMIDSLLKIDVESVGYDSFSDEIGDSSEEGHRDECKSFNFYVFFQAMYKLRLSQKKKCTAVDYSILNELYVAIDVEPQNELNRINKYVQLLELEETLSFFDGKLDGGDDPFRKRDDLKSELGKLEKEVVELVRGAPSLKGMFGKIGARSQCPKKIINWFKAELCFVQKDTLDVV